MAHCEKPGAVATDLCCGRLRLPPPVNAEAAPAFQRMPHITHGYRVDYSWLQCCASIFAVHNESMNVWTHFLALAYFLYLAGDTVLGRFDAGESSASTWPITVFLLSAASCALASTCFHLWGCRSANANLALIRWDMTGICGLIYGSYVPGLMYFFCCRPLPRYGYLTMITLLVGIAVYGANSAKLQARQFWLPRVIFFVCLVAVGVLPTLHFALIFPSMERLLETDTGGAPHGAAVAAASTGRSGLEYIVGGVMAMFVFYLIGFAFYFTGFPECRHCGRFNIWFSSHQCWHICIVIAVHVWYVDLCAFYHEYYVPLLRLGCGAASAPPGISVEPPQSTFLV